MSLPEITAPLGTPLFLAAGHSFVPNSVFSEIGTGTGHPRKRRVVTAAPRTQAVSWTLDEGQMLLVDDWFENGLIVGTLPFAAYLVSESGYLWWTAQWVAPYNAEILPGGHLWTVTGTLLLTGEGSTDGPVSTTGRLELGAVLTASVSPLITASAALEIGAALTQLHLARIELGALLMVAHIHSIEREDATYLLREDGGRILRETT